MSFQRPTIVSDEVPSPNANRPGDASASEATDWARRAGPRVKAGTTATPRRRAGSHAEAKASGVKPSEPSTSELHTSAYPAPRRSASHDRCPASGTPGNEIVMPQRSPTARPYGGKRREGTPRGSAARAPGLTDLAAATASRT